ncbi:MAG: hypothetical protein A3G25_19420 [Betaproteobacteria bacterium RIFCSPLOWO2_12_FULL_63_13]|nr:MAG: hypothetical protein A3G25_19420 [Betaproteobacteria bacterium RIFCSPLOWO2_12_FULL_63_13]
MGIGPAPAIRLLLERTGLKLSDIDRFEINEAFGAQCLAVKHELGLDHAKLNVNGGAVAIGHPLGATGVRLTVTVARELRRSGLRYGLSSACIGGGQGIALLVENPEAPRAWFLNTGNCRTGSDHLSDGFCRLSRQHCGHQRQQPAGQHHYCSSPRRAAAGGRRDTRSPRDAMRRSSPARSTWRSR